MGIKDRGVFFQISDFCLKKKKRKEGNKTSINKVLKHRKLEAEMSWVTVFGQKKGLWISLRPEQSVKGTVGSP